MSRAGERSGGARRGRAGRGAAARRAPLTPEVLPPGAGADDDGAAGPADLAPLASAALDAREPAAPILPTHAYLASLSPLGRRTMAERLAAVARLLRRDPVEMQAHWHRLRFVEVEAIRARMQEWDRTVDPPRPPYAPATINLTLAALKGIARYARDLGQLGREEYERIRAVKGVRDARLPAGRAAAADEIAALLRVCLDPPAPAGKRPNAGARALGIRDAAIITLLVKGGLRRAELVALTLDDWVPAPPHPHVRVRAGKGRRERAVPVGAGTVAAIERWLDLRGRAPGALFLRFTDRHGHLGPPGRHLTPQTVYDILDRRVAQLAREAGFEHLSPHDMRRTYIGELLDRGADIVTVQRLAGHASPVTTARYDRRPLATLAEAARLLDDPPATGEAGGSGAPRARRGRPR